MEPSEDRDGGRRQSAWTTLPAILTGVAAVVTAVAGLVAVFAGSGDDPPQPPTPTAVATQVVASVTATGTPERTATPARTATPRPQGRRGDDWPVTRSAYTVILASKTSRADANAVADAARGDLPDVGVLHSDEHQSLRPGYWVAYSGAFDARAPASQNAEDARAIGFPAAYVRYVQSGSPAE